MSWAEVQNLKDKMSALADATLYINVGKDYAGKTLMLKRYNSDYMSVTVGSQGTAEISVQPKSRYELVTSDAADGRTSDVFYVEAGEYKEVNWDMSVIDGDTVTPLNDVVILQKCAGIYDVYKYDTFPTLFGDSAACTMICNSTNAVKYMLRSTGTLADYATASNVMLAAINSVDSVRAAFAVHPVWSVKLFNSAYWATVCTAKVPVMPNSDSLQYSRDGFTVRAPGVYSTGHGVSNAFNGVDSPGWEYYNAPGYVAVEFPKACVIKKFTAVVGWSSPIHQIPWIIEASDDGTTWTEITRKTYNNQTSILYANFEISLIDNIRAFKHWRVYWATSNSNGNSTGATEQLSQCQFYGIYV